MPADPPDRPPHDDHDHGAEPALSFSYLGGRLAIDLVNTVSNWRGPEHPERYDNDKLVAYADLVAWTELAEAITPDEAEALRESAESRPAEAAAVLARTRALRLALHDVLTARLADETPAEADVAVLNDEVTAQLCAATLVASPDGFTLARAGDETALDAPLWQITRSTVDLLTTPTDLARVRTCAADVCGWMFLDTSGGRRRWCSMADCGNQAKVRRFRKRQRGTAARR
jgi:predicted RNA-binding Zn ribbon-like protein